MTHDSTAHLPKAADPAQMSDWKRDPCGLSAVVYRPARTVFTVTRSIEFGTIIRVVSGQSAVEEQSTLDDYAACRRAMSFAGVRVRE